MRQLDIEKSSAHAGVCLGSPSVLEVCWSCEKVDAAQLIGEVLSFDPRPSHQKGEDHYQMAIGEYDVEFRVVNDKVEILSVRKI